MSTRLVGPRVSRAETVSKAVEELIREKGLRPGERLGTKVELRERFGVAVATFNEALRMLEVRGVIDLRPGPGGGVFAGRAPALVRLGQKVLGLSGDSVTVADSLAVREALEPLIVADAVRHRTEADVAALRDLAVRMVECADPVGYLRANWALHRRIAEIGPNAILRQIYLGLLDFAEERIDDVTPLGAGRVPGPGALEVHHMLVEAIAQSDPEASARALTRHEALIG